MERFDWIEIAEKPAPEPAVREEESFDARSYLQQADRAYRYGSYETGMRQYAKALSEDAMRTEAWLGQVNCLIELEELDEARVWADKALDKFPDEPELLAAKSLTLARLGDAEDSMTLAARAIKKLNPSPYVWLQRGLALLCLDPRRHSRTCFMKALEGGDSAGAVSLRIGMGYLREKDYPNAKSFLAAAVEGDPKNPLTWYMLGRCCDGLYAYGRAIRCYERALEFRPEFKDQIIASLGRVNGRGFLAKLGASFRLVWRG